MADVTVHNPSAAGSGANDKVAEDVDIEAALKAGSVTAEEAVVLLQQQMDTRIESMRAELSSTTSPALSAVSAVLAHLGEAPMNFHQCTVFYAASTESEDAAMAARAGQLLCASAVMVLTQCIATCAVLSGNFWASCSSADQCHAGTFCALEVFGRCASCGAEVPLPYETEGSCVFAPNKYGWDRSIEDPACRTYNIPVDPNFVGFNRTRVQVMCLDPREVTGIDGGGKERVFPKVAVANWCESCVNAVDWSVDPMTTRRLVVDSINAMSVADWVALVVTSCIVAFTIGGELKDICLCNYAAMRAGDNLSASRRNVLLFLGGVRRWVFLPALVVCVPLLIMFKGSNALSICFNTVAILFLAELDNMAYALGLNERVRARVEKAGRVELDDEALKSLALTKSVHLVLIVAFILATIALTMFEAMFIPGTAFLVGGLIEACRLPEGKRCKQAAKTIGASLAGAGGVLFFTFFSMAT